MESLNKKTTTGISGGISFASAAAAGANKPAATTPATTAAGPAKNGGATATGAGAGTGAVASSPALGSQSSAPSGTAEPKAAAITTSTATNTNAAVATTTTSTSTTANANNGAIDWVLGMNVKVVTLADEVYEGQVFAYDCPFKSVSASATPTAYYSPSLGSNSNNSNTNNSNSNNNGNAGSRVKYDIRILKINYIKEVTPLSSAGASTTNTSSANHNGQSSITTSSQQSTSGDINITNNIYSTVLPAVGYVQLDKIQQREQQAIREAQAAAARIGVGVSAIGQDIFNALHKTLPCRWHDLQIIVMDEVIISPPYETENCKANASSSYVLARVKKVLEGERLRMANGRK